MTTEDSDLTRLALWFKDQHIPPDGAISLMLTLLGVIWKVTLRELKEKELENDRHQ